MVLPGTVRLYSIGIYIYVFVRRVYCFRRILIWKKKIYRHEPGGYWPRKCVFFFVKKKPSKLSYHHDTSDGGKTTTTRPITRVIVITLEINVHFFHIKCTK